MTAITQRDYNTRDYNNKDIKNRENGQMASLTPGGLKFSGVIVTPWQFFGWTIGQFWDFVSLTSFISLGISQKIYSGPII